MSDYHGQAGSRPKCLAYAALSPVHSFYFYESIPTPRIVTCNMRGQWWCCFREIQNKTISTDIMFGGGGVCDETGPIGEIAC